MHDTPIATLVEFLHALEVHDETEGLATLAKIPTLIACGDRDLLTPMEYSQNMADALPKSELVIVGGAGHLVQLDQPEVIDDALVRLVERATPSKLVALTRRRARPGSQPWLSVRGGTAELPTADDTVALGARLGAQLARRRRRRAVRSARRGKDGAGQGNCAGDGCRRAR